MFFFFFPSDELGMNPIIRQAFQNFCFEKILYDGYLDMSSFLNGSFTKEEMRYRLAAERSRYMILYQEDYPDEEVAAETWQKLLRDDKPDAKRTELSAAEVDAIVYWVYMTMRDRERRVKFTLDLFSGIKELYAIDHTITETDGVFYNAEKVELNIISTIAKFSSALAAINHRDKMLFFRGHADANYTLKPAVSRTEKWMQSEREMYNDLQIRCPEDFEKCHSHLEKLVEMQHYGLPTRLLDITQNPLVALYFACESKAQGYGEVVVFSVEKDKVKYPQSDTASILASLPAFDFRTQQQIKRLALDPSVSDAKFNECEKRLLHEIRLEKPAFNAEIRKEDVLNSIFILALRNNRRITKQEGAFILTGLGESTDQLNRFRYKNKKGKQIIFLIKGKENLLGRLSELSINRATLFPEIDCVAEFIKNQYENIK